MREILYRGKSVETGEWIYGYLAFFYTLGRNETGFIFTDKASMYSQEKARSYDVFAETVGQYTGVKDCNGVKIFEGDILLTDLKRPYNIVEFRNGSFVFNCNDGGKDYYDIMLPLETEQDQLRYLKVIGNVHDNPELLEEGAE